MVRSCIKFSAAIAIVLGLASATYAQETDNVIRPLTKAGSAAMAFTLGGVGTFGLGAPGVGTVTYAAPNSATSFQSTNTPIAGIAGKYFISDDLAIRLLLAFSTTSSGADSITNTNPPGQSTVTQFGIAAGLEWHMRPLYSTSPYIGAQVGYGMASTSSSVKVGTSDVTYKGSGSVFGIAAVAGFDWFFTRGIAIGAEYTLGFTSSSSSTTVPSGTNSSTTTSSPSTTSIGLGGGASVHAIVYF